MTVGRLVSLVTLVHPARIAENVPVRRWGLSVGGCVVVGVDRLIGCLGPVWYTIGGRQWRDGVR